MNRRHVRRRRRGSPAANPFSTRTLIPVERLEERRLLAARIWDGGGDDDNWSTAANWQEDVAPVAGDELQFLSSGIRRSNVNDYPAGTGFQSVLLSSSHSYTIGGNPITLSGDFATNGTTHTWAVPMTLGADVTVTASARQPFTLAGAIDTNGHALRLEQGQVIVSGVVSGSGRVSKGADDAVTLTAANTYTGGTTISAGALFAANVAGSATGTGDVTVGANGEFRGAGAVAGRVNVSNDILPGAATGTPAVVESGSLRFLGTEGAYNVNLDGTEPGTGYDQIRVHGAVDLGDGGGGESGAVATLTVAPSFTPPDGSRFTIIDNVGSGPTVGVFAGMPEGHEFVAGDTVFHITYTGGDGNDVVLTALPPLRTWDGGGGESAPNWTNAANWDGDVAPGSGDRLVFADDDAARAAVNDFPDGTPFRSITVGASGYDLSGNRVVLTTALTTTGKGSDSGSFSLPITLGGSVTVGGPATITDAGVTSNFVVSGPIDLNGNTLTLAPAARRQVTLGGAVSGSGAVRQDGDGTVAWAGAGAFTGPADVTGGTLNLTGSFPASGAALTVTGAAVSGTGTAGAITIGAGATLSPRNNAPAGGSAFTALGDVAFAGGSTLEIRLDATGSDDAGGSDALHVGEGGRVAIDVGSDLAASVTGDVTPGREFRIIDNEGPAPVAGRFDGLPQHAITRIGDGGGDDARPFRIDYGDGDGDGDGDGNDGNDVVLTALPDVSIWDGGGGDDDRWTNVENWAGDVAPAAGAALVFPAGAARRESTNDFPDGTAFDSINVEGDGYRLAGNRASLTGGVFAAALSGSAEIALPLTLAADAEVYLGSADGALLVSGEIDNGGHRLTLGSDGGPLRLSGAIGGTGPVEVAGSGAVVLAGSNTYTSLEPTLVRGGILRVDGAQPQAPLVLDGATLGGSGTAGDIVVGRASTLNPGDGGAGVLTVGGVRFAPGGAGQVVELFGETPGPGGYDRLNVSGTVALDGAGQLTVGYAPAFLAPEGSVYTIIDNDGADAVAGTFAGLPEGALVAARSLDGSTAAAIQTFRISYVGGDGNDVTLAAAPAGVLRLAAGSYTVGEGAGSVRVAVTRSGGTAGEVSVAYATAELPTTGAGRPDAGSRAARAGADFTPVTGTLTFSEGETEAGIDVPIAADEFVEWEESFFLALDAPAGDAVIDPAASEATVRIADATPPPALAVGDATADEGDVGTAAAARFEVTLSVPVAMPVTAHYTTADGTAAAGDDFTAAEGTLTFAPGETTKTVPVPVLGDTLDEETEAFLLLLTEATVATIADDSGMGMVVDDDAPAGAPNTTPTAADDVAAGAGGEAVNINVLANDADADRDPGTLAILGDGPAHGTATVDDGGTPLDPTDDTIRYTPDPGFSGTDSFEYRTDDGDGGSDTATVNVVVASTAALPDPADPSRTALVTGGTEGSDEVRYAVRNGQVEVIVNGESQGTFQPTGRVIAATGGGDDVVRFGKLPVPVQIDGGAGDDRLAGTPGPDILIGGDGNDRLAGHAGRDLLIGGAGRDTLAGGAGEDILVAGATAYDPQTAEGRAALADLLTGWDAAAFDYAAAIARVTQPPGAGASGARLAADTFFDDGEPDVLSGGPEDDLFAAGTNPGGDALRGHRAEEMIVWGR